MLKPILEVSHISNHYEGQPLLRNVSFTLESGEILCLLGPSGSGKTTLLRILAGLERADAGFIRFRGQDVATLAPHKRRFGLMFQEYALFPHKNVWDNVAFGPRMQKTPTTRLDEKTNTMLQMVGMSEFAHRHIDELSGGERQRVALARSLAAEPELLLLDEPLGSLDRQLRNRLATEIRSILQTMQITSIFVTHDHSEAFSVADRVAILHNGAIQQLDTPENLYRYPINQTVARFLGFTNFLDPHEAATLGLHATSVPQQTSGELLLVRPEGAHLAHLVTQEAMYDRLQLTGRVQKRRFLGDRFIVTVLCKGLPLDFHLPNLPQPPDIDEPIDLLINPAALTLIDSA